MTSAPAGMERIGQLLQRGAAGLCAFYLALRPLSPGLDTAEPEAVFLSGVALLAAMLGVLSLFARDLWLRPHLRFWLPTALLVSFSALAVHTAAATGNYQLAVDLGGIWLADLFLLIAILTAAQDAESCRRAFRLYLSCFAAGVIVVAAYSMYQRYWGLDYLRRICGETGGTTYGDAFNIRLGSDRVGGPFSYANALAAYLLLALPLLWQGAREAAMNAGGTVRVWILRAGLLLTLTALVYSGSKAGLAVTLLLQWAGLAMRLPEGKRKITRLLATAGWQGVSLLIALLAAWGVTRLAGVTAGETVFAIGWFCGFLYLPDWLARAPRGPGLAALILALVAGGIGAGLIYRAPEGGKLAQIRFQIWMQTGVRWGYWQGAAGMIADHPLRGVGLDNFGERYPQYKPATAWEVRRAHNHYLQLTADGGLPLLASFALLMLFFFLPNRKKDRMLDAVGPSASPLPLYPYPRKKDAPAAAEEMEEERIARSYRRYGIFAALAAFAVTYFFCLTGAFTGLSLEYFTNELAMSSTSILRATGKSWALWLHGGVHLALLPLLWVLIFRAFWRVTGNAPEWISCLKLGLAGVLLHGCFDFSLYHAAVAATFWAVLALTRLAGTPAQTVRLPAFPARLAMVAILAAGLAYFSLCISPRLEASIASSIGQKLLIAPKSQKELTAAAEAISQALVLRPADAGLHISLGQLMLRARSGGLPVPAETILAEFDQAIAAAPQSAAARGAKAHALLLLSPGSRTASEQAAALLREAVQQNPNKPQYHLRYAEQLFFLGHKSEAAAQAARAAELSAGSLDEQAQLTPEEQALLRRITEK